MAKAVPWKDWGEWQRVRLMVLSERKECKQKARDTIRDWQSRNRVPISVEATGFIITSMLEEEDGGLVDAQTVTRFVNLLTDLVQRGFYAANVETLANSIGIPSWIVQLRHSACHGSILPRASLLKRALQYLMDRFIVPKYWDAQALETFPNPPPSASRDAMGDSCNVWNIATLKCWIDLRLREIPDETRRFDIIIGDDALYWIVCCFKDQAAQLDNSDIYWDILGQLLGGLLSHECRHRLLLLATRYGNSDVICYALNDTCLRPSVNTLLLLEAPSSVHQYQQTVLRDSQVVSNHDGVRFVADGQGCSGCYFIFDRLLEV